MHLSLRWDHRLPSWWTNRLKPEDAHDLTIHNVYVLPTKAGWMMLVNVAVLMLATINYQLSLGYVLIFLLMGAGLVGLFLAHRAITRTRLSLLTNRELRGFAGETISVDIEVQTKLLGGVQTRVETLPLGLGRAGSQPLPRLVCETRYPLGLLRLWSVWRPLSHAQVDESGDAAIGRYLSRERSLAPDGTKTSIRAYRVGDAPRDLLWKTVAKRPDTPSSWGVRAVGDDMGEATFASLLQSSALPNAAHSRPFDEPSVSKHRDVLLLGSLLFIALPFFQHLVWWYPLFASSLIAWRLSGRKSPKWLQLPLILLLGILVWIPFRAFSGIEASVSACIGLLGIKALELPYRKASDDFSRDHWVLVFLGLFTLSAHFLVSQSLTSSAQVVLGLITLLYVLVISHSRTRQPIQTTLYLVIFGAPFMAAMFFLFPRFAPLWTLQEQKNIAQTGLTSEMRVGDMSEISRDNKIILRLQMDELPYLDSKDIYLRSYVLPRFDGRTWSGYRPAFGEAVKPKIELDNAEATGRGFTLTLDGEKPYRANISADVRNNAESLGRSYLQTAASLPLGSNPRTSQWIQGLREDARYQNYSVLQWSNHLIEVLRSGGYRYTLAPGSSGLHVVDELLFDRKLGFCEHYASAYVVAMRNLGIPARIVTGYQGAEINPIDGLQVVRNSNAHAWAEYWDGTGDGKWHRVDPTAVIAPARIQNAQNFNQAPQQLVEQGRAVWSSGMLAPIYSGYWRARQSWEAANHAWEAWFNAYNQGAQMNLLKRLGFSDPSWKDLVQLLDVALLLMLLVAAAIYVLRGRMHQDPWESLLQAIRDKASERGALPTHHATPRELVAYFPSLTVSQHQWLIALEVVRYAPEKMRTTDLATLKRQFKKLFSDS